MGRGMAMTMVKTMSGSEDGVPVSIFTGPGFKSRQVL